MQFLRGTHLLAIVEKDIKVKTLITLHLIPAKYLHFEFHLQFASKNLSQNN